MPYTAEESKIRRKVLKDNHQCTICTIPLSSDDITFAKCSSCRSTNNKMYTAYREKLKLETFNHYGGAYCTCCKESEITFLQLDHINGGGNEQRRAIGKDGGKPFYQWLKQQGFPNGYQVLCANCNIGRHRNRGTCPHAYGS